LKGSGSEPFREWHLKRKKSTQSQSKNWKADSIKLTLAAIGGLPLAGSGFEDEPADSDEFSERALSISEVEG